MGREVRRVPPGWEHPKRYRDPIRYQPLRDGYNKVLKEFEDAIKEKGLEKAIEWFGGGPLKDEYMPDWPEEERTHYQMYEITSEGTPISPVMETPEELARWLADNSASAFGGMTCTYEEWLGMIVGPGWAPSGVMIPGEGIKPGVSLSTPTPDDRRER